MRRVLFVFLALVLMMPTVSADDETPKLTEKQINLIRNRLFSGNHRSISEVPEAFLNQHSNTIRIECFSESELLVCICSSSGEVIISEIMIPCTTSMTINAPTDPGEYLLTIQSNDLYAEGLFTIE